MGQTARFPHKKIASRSAFGELTDSIFTGKRADAQDKDQPGNLPP